MMAVDLLHYRGGLDSHTNSTVSNRTPCCIIGQQTNVDWNALVPLVSNGNKHRCTYVHLKIFILVDVVTLLYMDEVK